MLRSVPGPVCNAVESRRNYNLNVPKLNLTIICITIFYLGIQLEGVLSTSQAAKSFMGTGFDALVIFSDLFFSVILNQHRCTTGYNFHSTALSVGFNLHCYLITKHSTIIIFILLQKQTGYRPRHKYNNTQYTFILRWYHRPVGYERKHRGVRYV